MTRFPRFAAVCLPRADAELARRLLVAAPWIEIHGDLVLLDPRGTERIHGEPAGLFAALRAALAPERARGMALASRRLTAELAARHGVRLGRRRGGGASRSEASGSPENPESPRHDEAAYDTALLIPPGDEALFLSRLPLQVLEIPPRLAKRWAPLGLETLGDLAALPAASVETRYGAEGLALHRLARGLDERSLCPEAPRDALCVEHACAHPVDRLPQLEPLLAEACARLASALTQLGEGALKLVLRLQLDAPEGAPSEQRVQSFELRLPEAETRAALLLDLLCQQLTQQAPPRAVLGFALRVAQSGAQAVHQNALFSEVSRDASRRREALARAGELLGAQAVQPLTSRAEHLPERRWAHAERVKASRGPAQGGTRGGGRAGERGSTRAASGARVPESAASTRVRPADAHSPLVLRQHEPPENLVPLLAGGQLVGFRWGARQLDIERLSPPRRLEGGWWSEHPWARDEYELLTCDGALYRVGRDLRARRWLLLGELD
ncbi:MAG: hypothetical protein DHS20C15_03250 [Planctomycetota bacterium]|nr:MAG: hypothetical protein DHS20C15_03250 [Planctomycetota bacterium]